MNNNTKLKPFNLERALAGDPVVTGDGKNVSQLHMFNCEDPFCLYGVISGETLPSAFKVDGSWGVQKYEVDKNLFMAPVKKEGWVNLSSSNDVYCNNCIYKTKEEAFVNKLINYIDTVKIEWEE